MWDLFLPFFENVRELTNMCEVVDSVTIFSYHGELNGYSYPELVEGQAL